MSKKLTPVYMISVAQFQQGKKQEIYEDLKAKKEEEKDQGLYEDTFASA